MTAIFGLTAAKNSLIDDKPAVMRHFLNLRLQCLRVSLQQITFYFGLNIPGQQHCKIFILQPQHQTAVIGVRRSPLIQSADSRQNHLQRGHRYRFGPEGKETVVIDFDIGLRNLDLIMGQNAASLYDFVNVIQGDASLNQALIKDGCTENLYSSGLTNSR